MPTQTRIVAPGPHERAVQTMDGQIFAVSAGWELLPPGDAALTRRVKAGGPSWTVQEKKGRRTFSRGVWAPASRIAALRAELKSERSTVSYAKRRQSESQRRERRQASYVAEFQSAVVSYLDFARLHADVAKRLADAVTAHATPVGSGTVARTARIPIGQRAESAVIAWLRHQTTAYDNMKIARIKGKRREVRRMLAAESCRLLADYRAGITVDPQKCPLQQSLRGENMGVRVTLIDSNIP